MTSSGEPIMNNPFRALPSITKLMETPALVEGLARLPRAVLVEAARRELARLRALLSAGEMVDCSVDLDALAVRILAAADRDAAPRFRAVINATGVVLHTNLGRAPLHELAAQAAYEAARGYLDLEIDL